MKADAESVEYALKTDALYAEFAVKAEAEYTQYAVKAVAVKPWLKTAKGFEAGGFENSSRRLTMPQWMIHLMQKSL